MNTHADGYITYIYTQPKSNRPHIKTPQKQQGLLRLVHSTTTPSLGGHALIEKLVGLCLAEFRRKAGCDARESPRAMAKVCKEGFDL